MKLLMKMFNLTIDIFIALYLWDLSGGSVAILCKYYSIFVLGIFMSMFLLSPVYAKKKIRKTVSIIGQFLQLGYFVLIYILKASCINHVCLLAVLNGIGCGIYYSVYNIYEAEGIDNDLRPRVMGYFAVLNAIISACFPVIIGIAISFFGMQFGIITGIAITVVSIALCILYHDNGCSLGTKFSYKSLITVLKSSDNLKESVKTFAITDLSRGFINSYGSFKLFIQVWTMIAFSTVVWVGSVSGISTTVKILFGAVFSRFGTKLHSKNVKVFVLLRVCVVLSLVFMGMSGSAIGLLFLTLTFNCSEAIESPIYNTASATVSNSGSVSAYKPELYIIMEASLTITRLLGYGMLWLWGSIGGASLWVCILLYGVVLLIMPRFEDKLYRLAYNVK